MMRPQSSVRSAFEWNLGYTDVLDCHWTLAESNDDEDTHSLVHLQPQRSCPTYAASLTAMVDSWAEWQFSSIMSWPTSISAMSEYDPSEIDQARACWTQFTNRIDTCPSSPSVLSPGHHRAEHYEHYVLTVGMVRVTLSELGSPNGIGTLVEHCERYWERPQLRAKQGVGTGLRQASRWLN